MKRIRSFAGFRLLGFAVLIVLVGGAGCNRPKQASSKGSLATTPQPDRASVTMQAPDAFYDPPAELPRKPGELLRSEPLKDVLLPAGVRGWRILYATSVNDNTPATAVATVFAPGESSGGPWPIVAWEHATTGLMQQCMPSLLSASSKGIFDRNQIVMNGWVVVATDYSFAEKGGPHPYLIGEGEARAALDSVRAARQISGLSLDKRVIAWGYSQGGHAALWIGIVAPRYAPELEICGVAAIAPATNIEEILTMNIEVDKRFGPYLAQSYSRFYPDITFEQAIRPEALDAARQIVNLCDFLPQEDQERIETLVTSFEGPALATTSNEALRAHLEENTPDRPIQAPVVIAQGLADQIVPPSVTDAYVERRCAAGQQLEYWTFAGRDHITIIQPDTPLEEPLIRWTTARLATEPVVPGCLRKSF